MKIYNTGAAGSGKITIVRSLADKPVFLDVPNPVLNCRAFIRGYPPLKFNHLICFSFAKAYN